jgi:hypothetical protein
VIKLTSCLPMVGGSLQVLRLLPPLKLVTWYSWNIAESGVKTPKINQNQINFQVYQKTPKTAQYEPKKLCPTVYILPMILSCTSSTGYDFWSYFIIIEEFTLICSLSRCLSALSPDLKGHVRYCCHLLSYVNFYILIFFSETTRPIGTKLGRNVH